MSPPSHLPAELSIEPRGALDADVRVPGSKSITNRALLLAALARGESRLEGALRSDDTDVMREALAALGAQLETRGDVWSVCGTDGRLRAPDVPLYVGNSGTSARFLTAAATLAPDAVTIDGNARMRQRPIAHLVEALRSLGARIEVLGHDGCPPVRVGGGGLPGGSGWIDASQSSQYVSALLQVAPYARNDIELRFRDGAPVSRPYIELTLDVMRDFGAQCTWLEGDRGVRVKASRRYEARTFAIEPDASSAAYPLCAAAIAGGVVRLQGMPEHSLQADFALLPLLESMGCRVRRGPGELELRGPERALRSLGEVDMNALPDAALAYAVVALFADSPTHIRNVGNLRIKETDRLLALETELRKLGAGAHADRDSLRIEPRTLHGARIDTYDDHRMAMAFSLAGLRVPGVVIRDPGCVSKTWPQYFEFFRHL